VEKLAPRLVGALVGVRPKVIALGLEQVGRQAFAAEPVEVAERRGERGRRDAV
jgi:hypothetical protein